MRLRKYFLTIVLLLIYRQIFCQVDRQNAKFMDTCAINVISSGVLIINNPTDSTNQFKVSCNCELPKYRLSIFDRWGKFVLTSYDINDKLKFSDIKNGVYVWVVEVKYPNGKKTAKKGQ